MTTKRTWLIFNIPIIIIMLIGMTMDITFMLLLIVPVVSYKSMSDNSDQEVRK